MVIKVVNATQPEVENINPSGGNRNFTQIERGQTVQQSRIPQA